MTIGIYKLSFYNTNKVYIGQSGCIEKRWASHTSNLKLGKASPKLQEAHNTYGVKSYEILCECSVEELNDLEIEAIQIFDSYNNGFNSTPSATGPCLYGETNPSSIETNEVYKKILQLLVQESPTLSKRQIAELCNTSIYAVRHLASLETHCWLKQDMPLEYAKLELLKQSKYYRGIQYPKLLSPEGIVYEITHLSNFSKEHNLLQPKVSELMKGTRNTHKGWTRFSE